jgi:hypothetical protein
MPKQLYIIGSCVSRDAIAYDDAGEFTLKGYSARSSFASSTLAIPKPDIYSARIASKFQRQQVSNDFCKTLLGNLAKSRFDLLLIDFIDERFPLFAFDEGGLVTISIELHQLGVLKNLPGRIIPAFSPEHLELWDAGWQRFIDHAKTHEYLHKIRLSRLYWLTPPETNKNLSQTWLNRPICILRRFIPSPPQTWRKISSCVTTIRNCNCLPNINGVRHRFIIQRHSHAPPCDSCRRVALGHDRQTDYRRPSA